MKITFVSVSLLLAYFNDFHMIQLPKFWLDTNVDTPAQRHALSPRYHTVDIPLHADLPQPIECSYI